MSRHRNMSHMYEDAYEDDNYESGSDYAGSYGVSPSLENYMYKRGQGASNQKQQHHKQQEQYEEEYEDDYEMIEEALAVIKKKDKDIEKKFDRDDIEEAIRNAEYDGEAAYASLVKKQKEAAAKSAKNQKQPPQKKNQNNKQQPNKQTQLKPTNQQPATTTQQAKPGQQPQQQKKEVYKFTEPSPDDVAQAKRAPVTMKQNDIEPFKPVVKGSPKAQPAAATTPKKPTFQIQKEEVQHEQAEVTPSSSLLAEALKTPSKEAKVDPFKSATKKAKAPEDTSKTRLNVVIIGHVDAGKSTLMGHLLVDTGVVSEKLIHKYKKESQEIGKSSFFYAWVLDENPEERARGVTIDIGVRYFETPHKYVTILDAPGHRDFIPNMITGAAQADVAILVVDSTPGAFEAGFQQNGQTKEHLILARSLGINQLLVVVNKLDVLNWSKERFDEIVSKVAPFLKQLGYAEKDVVFVPCSGLTGENLTKKCEKIPWYTGASVLDEIDKIEPAKRDTDKPFRLAIADVYKSQQSGVTVAGRVEGGYISSGDKVLLVPLNLTCTVKTILRGKQTIKTAYAGDNVELGLQGIDAAKLHVGLILCDPAEPIKITNRFAARVITFDPDIPITKGAEAVLHIGHINVPASVSKLVGLVKGGDVVQKKPRALTGSQTAIVEILTEQPICIELYSDYKAFGRFMLRTGGKTIASGIVTELKRMKKAKTFGSSQPPAGTSTGEQEEL